jgi:hypothetical protein
VPRRTRSPYSVATALPVAGKAKTAPVPPMMTSLPFTVIPNSASGLDGKVTSMSVSLPFTPL